MAYGQLLIITVGSGNTTPGERGKIRADIFDSNSLTIRKIAPVPDSVCHIHLLTDHYRYQFISMSKNNQAQKKHKIISMLTTPLVITTTG